jgi:NAD(P)-dependent dehydrogenase (short-subunit alcohol dehydrogenase family)
MNAATFALDGPGTMMPLDLEGFIRVMRINALASAYVAAMFEEHVAVRKKRGKVFIGSCSGSICDKGAGGRYPYWFSKAALNMVARSDSIDFFPQGIMAVVMHPGSVATEIRTSATGIAVSDSVSGLRSVINGLTLGISGPFPRYYGGEIEW